MTRVLRIKLEVPVRQKLLKRKKYALARDIGISPQKLQDIIDDKWNYVTRDSLERVADFLGLDVKDVFEFAPSPFWHTIEHLKSCTFLRGSPKRGAESQTEFRIPKYDNDATTVVKSYLHDIFGVLD